MRPKCLHSHGEGPPEAETDRGTGNKGSGSGSWERKERRGRGGETAGSRESQTPVRAKRMKGIMQRL